MKSLLHNQLQDAYHAGITDYESFKALFKLRRAWYEETAQYRKRFLAVTEVLEHVGISFKTMFQGIADEILRKRH